MPKSLRLTAAELDLISQTVNARLITYIQHDVSGGLKRKEKEHLKFLRKLHDKLERAANG